MTSKTIKTLVVSILSAISLLISSGFGEKQSGIQFIRPQGWPKPVYNFKNNEFTDAGYLLGRKLFFDPALSADGTISCGSCHSQGNAFSDKINEKSIGFHGLHGTRNALPLFNLAWNTSFMWDGGVNNLEVQPLAPITNVKEMNNTLDNIVHYLNKSTAYKRAFYEVYEDSVVSGQHVLKALAQYLALLESYNSKYDKYVRNEPGGELTEQELNGLKIFRRTCESCHKEPLFTDFSYRNIGLPVDKGVNDMGRYQITQDRGDSLKFKVPSLRNVAVTYPYMHDGRFKTLREVLDFYTGRAVISDNIAREMKDGMFLTEQDKNDMIAFLNTLTDKDFLTNKHYKDNGK